MREIFSSLSKVTCFSLGLFVPLLSCKSRVQTTLSNIDVNSIDAIGTAPFEPCAKPGYPSFAYLYLEKVFAKLVEGSPQIFTGDFAPQNICLETLEQSAIASRTDSRSVKFGYAVFRKLNSDAEIAGIFAHELAHIFRRHNWGAIPEQMAGTALGEESAVLSKQARILKLKTVALHDQLRTLRTHYQAQLAQISDGVDFRELRAYATQVSKLREQENLDLFTFLRSLEQVSALVAYQGEPQQFAVALEPLANTYKELERKALATRASVSLFTSEADALKLQFQIYGLEIERQRTAERLTTLYNNELGPIEGGQWQEREADEYGLRIYAAAGFPIDQMTAFWERSEQAPVADVQKCLQQQEPDRGVDPFYPATCWRIWNLRVRLRNSLNFSVTAAPARIVDPSLEDVKLAIGAKPAAAPSSSDISVPQSTP